MDIRNADKLVAQIEARGLKWDVYRMDRGGWLVKVEDGYWRSHTDDSLIAALAWAVDVQFLPLVPLRPSVRSYEVRKAGGGRWQIFSGGFVQWESKTKKAALEAIEKAEQRERDAFEEWTRRYAPVVANGEAGVDFYWDDPSGRIGEVRD